MKKDIETRDDITKMVRSFYEKLLMEKEFDHIFFQVAEIDIMEHIDMIVDFWESVIFRTGQYKRNTMETHLTLHRKHPLTDWHFNKWLKVFEENVNVLYKGDHAEIAKQRARSIAGIMKFKIDDLDQMMS